MHHKKPDPQLMLLYFLLSTALGLCGYALLSVIHVVPGWPLPAPAEPAPTHAAGAVSTEQISPPSAVTTPSRTPEERARQKARDDKYRRLSSQPPVMRLTLQHNASLLLTDTKGRREGYLDGTASWDEIPVAYQFYLPGHESVAEQQYRFTELAPVTATILGKSTGPYRYWQTVSDHRFSLQDIPTQKNVKDTIRFDIDTNRLSIQFDSAFPERRGSFTFNEFLNVMGPGNKYACFGKGLPVIPGATLSFTDDLAALQAGLPGMTVALDTDSDGDPERSVQLAPGPPQSNGSRAAELNPETPEFQKLFGIGVPSPKGTLVVTPPQRPVRSATPKSASAGTWQTLGTTKSITFNSIAALATVTDADGRKLEPTDVYGSSADPNHPERKEFQEYRRLEYAPTTMQVEGQTPGKYNLTMILKGAEAIVLSSFETNSGIVDTIRHDDNVISFTFDAKRPRGDTFTLEISDAIRSGNHFLRVHQLPIIPATTLTLTIDWQALRQDRAPLTVAVDADGDGQAERSVQVKGQRKDHVQPEFDLTPDSPEFKALFGTGTIPLSSATESHPAPLATDTPTPQPTHLSYHDMTHDPILEKIRRLKDQPTVMDIHLEDRGWLLLTDEQGRRQGYSADGTEYFDEIPVAYRPPLVSGGLGQNRQVNQRYTFTELVPVTATITGDEKEIYEYWQTVGHHLLHIDQVPTRPGLRDTIRFNTETNSLAIHFDPTVPERRGSFLLLDGINFVKNLEKPVAFEGKGVPVIPGATLTFTDDIEALQAGQPGITVALDTDSDGQPERSVQIAPSPPDPDGSRAAQLTPEMPEFKALFETKSRD